MSEKSHPNRRRILLSHPGVQLRIIISFGLIMVAYATTNFYINIKTFESIDREMQRLSMPLEVRNDTQILLAQHKDVLMRQLQLFTFLAVVIILMSGVFLSHCIGGPLTQLNNYLRAIVEGKANYRLIHFRKHDLLRNLERNFNNFQKKLGLLDTPKDDRPADSPSDAG